MSALTRRRFLQAGTALTTTGIASKHLVAPVIAREGGAPPKFRLGIVTYNIAANWDMPTLLSVCKGVGLSPVELRTTHKHGVEPALGKDERKEVKQRFADAGIEIWGCGSVCEFHSPDPAVVKKNIETCKEFVELTADIGGKGVKVRPNDLPTGVPAEKTIEQIGKSLIECGKSAANAGVEIWVEVHGSRGAADPPNVKKMMEQCGHPSVGLTWNSNPTDLKDGSVTPYFELLRPWIKSCHINELHSGYPYRDLFRLLRQTGYDRVTLAEIPGMPDRPTGERLMRYYKALWTELAKG